MLLSVAEWKLLKKCLDRIKNNHDLYLSDEEWSKANKLSKKLDIKIIGEEKQTILVKGQKDMTKYPKTLYENDFVKFVKYEIGIYGIEHKEKQVLK